ncbi:MAG: UvrD-helicase domain-containing protein [Treponema sp.]|nr:UvrD-helicase domain-containing protein [Treponema sp.]
MREQHTPREAGSWAVDSAAPLSFLSELDEEQLAAVYADSNTVVSAGAGSGKTRALAARYGRFILEGVCKVDEILTITFTNKAANEMYSRIYRLLSGAARSSAHAREAVANFHRASIFTLDHFCAAVARSASRRFGIGADFVSDEGAVRDLARSLALRFVLDKRNDSALQQLIAEHKIRAAADKLFADPVLAHSPLSRPLDFEHFARLQKNELLAQWKIKTGELSRLLDEMRGHYGGGKLFDTLDPLMKRIPPIPRLEDLFTQSRAGDAAEKARGEIGAFFAFLSALCDLYIKKDNRQTASYRIVQQHYRRIKGSGQIPGLRAELEAIANPALQWDTVLGVFPLIAEYQKALNQKKRETGMLTFTDIAHLAVDALIRFPDIRSLYKNTYKKIMIDEFQDNNSLQRDLVYLLAEKQTLCGGGVPAPEDLCPGKVFFVGDEKQSIYRFRGADVSVFRRLSRDIGGSLALSRNYRSHPDLIRAFNRIFGGLRSEGDTPLDDGVFPPAAQGGEDSAGTEGRPSTPDYEASYRWTKSGEGWGEGKRLHFAFFDEDRMPDNDPLKGPDYEAAYTAAAILNLVREGRLIRDKKTKSLRPCAFGDIAVLQRSYTNQHALEKQFKLFDIPFFTDRPSALLYDAPVNDMWSLLKLLVYPKDRVAYAALLRSPFVRLSEEALTLCLLRGGDIFDPAPEEDMGSEDLIRYRAGRKLYEELLNDCRELPVSGLISKLWYDSGYRFETLWLPESQPYGELYDLFFEAAHSVEKQGKSLVDFLDYLEALASREEKPDDLELPGEEDSGVRILSIHRCKGLEFPVVFLYGCGVRENMNHGGDLALYTERWGLTLRLPQAGELARGGDYFLDAEKKEDRLKTTAELRRLLYVAMTRAESELFVTACMSGQNEEEKKKLQPESLDPLDYFYARYEQFKTKPAAAVSFFRLLPLLTAGNPLYTLEPIWEHGQNSSAREDIALSAAASRAAYEGIPCRAPAPPVLLNRPASGLRAEFSGPRPHAPPPEKEPKPVNSAQAEFDFEPPSAARVTRADLPVTAAQSGAPVDALIEACGIKAEEFGTLVHRFIEERFRGGNARLPPALAGRLSSVLAGRLTELAAAAADGFFASALGKRAAGALWRESEFPFITAVPVTGPAAPAVTISGVMDLVFEAGGLVHVVDFKSDRVEDISKHLGQLAVYRRAAADIFPKTDAPRCWLFYLRSGAEYDVTPAVETLDVELLLR